MTLTPLDLLFLAIAFVVLFVGIMFGFLILEAIRTMRNVTSISEKSDEIVGVVDQYVRWPMTILSKISEYIQERREREKKE